MDPIFYYIIGFILVSGIGFYLFAMWYAAKIIIRETLTRKDKTLWGRAPSSNDENQLKMDVIGKQWQKEYAHCKRDVHIVRDGLNLYGEYYDLGFDKCVFILSGRTESLRYGYFYARPYTDSGYNLLVIDPRAHGESDCIYNTVGFQESKDALAWAEFIHNTFNIDHIVYHGICIGAATGMLGITSENPDYIKGMVTEGMFARFRYSMTNNLKKRNKNFFLLIYFINARFKKLTGHTMFYGPYDVIDKMEKPLLMLQSKKDPFSTPEKAQELFDKCASKQKQLVYFDEGGHSLLRITDTEKYDNAIKSFLATL